MAESLLVLESAVMSASPDCVACRPGPRCHGPGAGRLCAHPLAAVPVTLSVWTLNGPAVDLWWAWDVPGDLVPLENRIRLVTCRFSVRQAARVYSLIKP